MPSLPLHSNLAHDRWSPETTHAARQIINQIERRRQRDLGMKLGRLTARSPGDAVLVKLKSPSAPLKGSFDNIADYKGHASKILEDAVKLPAELALH